MTNEGILEIAMRQSAIDANCQAGSALTSRLALEVLDRGKVPFNGTAWSNIRSVRNAIKSGFRPAWIELTAKSQEFVAEMNQ
ncbi:hypothetical protein [Lacrimispora sp.]|uniref:hypothetical protein n=1 Tax=Lacrimispora sp. TaxID=2719234 RepID=UPI0028A83679|nr:hypothetical protein [Lacrimispora sp.]